jgi:predicted phosphodiesterase
VRGNVDHGAWTRALPATALVEAFGANLFLLHNLAELDVDPAAAGIAMVLYGHTHVPKEEEKGGVRYVNPGSIGPRRFDLPVSFAFLGEDLSVAFVRL